MRESTAGSSVLFDAVAIWVSEEGAQLLVNEFTARDFVADAFARLEFIAFTPASHPLLVKAGLECNEGCFDLTTPAGVQAFVKGCARLRQRARAPKVEQVWAFAADNRLEGSVLEIGCAAVAAHYGWLYLHLRREVARGVAPIRTDMAAGR